MLNRYALGQSIEVFLNGKWYPSHILKGINGLTKKPFEPIVYMPTMSAHKGKPVYLVNTTSGGILLEHTRTL